MPTIKKPKRIYRQGHLHFITFSCYHRLPLLLTPDSRNLFLQELLKVQTEYEFALLGYVVMPTHIHLLISEPNKSTLSIVLKMLKQRVSHKILNVLDIPLVPDSRIRLPQLWQPRFYDFNVYSHKKKNEKLHYIHANPVKNALVQHPSDWPWSSFSAYTNDAPGLIQVDQI